MCKNSGEGLYNGQFLFSVKTSNCFVTKTYHNKNISRKLSGTADAGICCLAAENVQTTKILERDKCRTWLFLSLMSFRNKKD